MTRPLRRPPSSSGRPERFGGYRAALRVPPFRRLFLGEAVSGLGDGCGFVAVAWLALELAPPGQRPYAVGLAIAAYSLPGALVGLAVASRLAGVEPRVLLIGDAALRVLLLGTIPLLRLLGGLQLWAYLCLLAGSSLLSSVGRGGYVSAVASHIPEPRRFAANSLLGSTEAVTVMLIGPALGGVLVATVGAPLTLATDAGSFLALLWAGLTLPAGATPAAPAAPASRVAPAAPAAPAAVAGPAAPAGRSPRPRLRLILRRPLIGWLLAITVVFYGLYGPFETALPIFTRTNLHGGAALYGALWACLGGGALVGSLAAGTRTVTRIERFALLVVFGWGLCVIVVGASGLAAVAAVGMAFGGVIYAPYPAITTTALQRLLPPAELAAGAAAWSAILTAVTPATTAAGGPLVAAIGARATLLTSGAATIALAALVTGVHQRAGRRERRPESGAQPDPSLVAD